MLALVSVGWAAAPAAAQGTVTTEEGRSEKATLTGTVLLNWICRDELFEAVFPRRGPLPIRPNAERFGDFVAMLGLNAELENKFGVMLLLQTNADPYGGENHRMGDDANTIRVEEAYLYAKKFGFASFLLDVRLGVQNVRSDLRGRRGHGAFFLDLHNSEDPFTGAAHTASTVGGLVPTGVNPAQSGTPNPLWVGSGGAYYVVPGLPIQPVDPDPTASFFGFNPFLGGNAWVNNLVGQSKRSEFGGVFLQFAPTGRFNVSVFAGTTMESGTAHADTQVGGAIFESRFQLPGSEQDSLIRLTYASFMSGGGVAVHSGGIGFELVTLNDMVSAYGEFVGQGGVYTNVDRPGARDHTPQKSWAWYSGGRIEVPFSLLGVDGANTSGQLLFVDGSYWHVSGDDGDPNQANEDFLSFESVQSGLLVEGSDYGFDIDTNYHAVKVEAGVVLECLSLSVFWGNYWLNHAPVGNVGSTAAIRQRLGNELDLRLRLMNLPVDNVEILFAAGILFQSSFFSTLVRQRDALEGLTSRSRDHLHRALLCMLLIKIDL
jgi:hypothetical protein